MREYFVQVGDSQASIAAKPEHAGCPKCGGADFVRANPHKASKTHPNGYVSFVELRAGEKLVIPEKWFDGSMDRLPPSYFAALPHPDGVTPPKSGVLGDYGAAYAAVGALAAMDDNTFSTAVGPACALIDQSVSAADSSVNPGIAAYVAATHIGTNAAKQRNLDLIKAINAGDQKAVAEARQDIQTDLATAIDSAQLALGATGGMNVDIGPATIDPSIVAAAAQAAAAAIAADPSFCASVAQSGTAVNAATHAFKTAWNAANPGNPVPINTGTYEQATADAITKVLGSAPTACAGRASPTLPSFSSPPGTIVPPQDQPGLSTGAVWGLGALGAGVVGTVVYLATKRPPVRVRRVRA